MMQWSYDTLLKWGTDELTAHDVENAAAGASGQPGTGSKAGVSQP